MFEKSPPNCDPDCMIANQNKGPMCFASDNNYWTIVKRHSVGMCTNLCQTGHTSSEFWKVIIFKIECINLYLYIKVDNIAS